MNNRKQDEVLKQDTNQSAEKAEDTKPPESGKTRELKKHIVVVEKCNIYRNAHVGIEIRDHANPLIKGGIIRDGKRSGVLVCDYGKGTIEEDCHIFGNAFFGVLIMTGGYPVLKVCRVNDNGYSAISVDGQSGVVIENGCDLISRVGRELYRETGCKLQDKRKKSFIAAFRRS